MSGCAAMLAEGPGSMIQFPGLHAATRSDGWQCILTATGAALCVRGDACPARGQHRRLSQRDGHAAPGGIGRRYHTPDPGRPRCHRQRLLPGAQVSSAATPPATAAAVRFASSCALHRHADMCHSCAELPDGKHLWTMYRWSGMALVSRTL